MDQKRKFSNKTLPNPVHIFLNYRLQTELNLNFFEQTQFKWTPYVEANRTNVAICFLYFKTYPYLANTIIMRKWSPQLRPLVTQNFYFSRNFKTFDYRWSFLIHESCIALKSYSVEKNGSFRYLLPELSNCFYVYSPNFKQTIRDQSFNDYRSFEDFSFTTWYKIKYCLPSFLDIFIN